jgi:hypothetical protein
LSSGHAEIFEKFAISPHVKHELQKQVRKGSEERHGERREGSEEEKHEKMRGLEKKRRERKEKRNGR